MTDGFDLLEAEHRRIDALFENFLHDNDDAIADEICEALTLHALVEEAALYPALRRYVDDGDDLADDAAQEHAVVKTLIARIYDVPRASLLDVVTQMRRDVEAHVRNEQSTLFPAMRDSGVDAEVLGAALESRPEPTLRHRTHDDQLDLNGHCAASARGSLPAPEQHHLDIEPTLRSAAETLAAGRTTRRRAWSRGVPACARASHSSSVRVGSPSCVEPNADGASCSAASRI